ncbi:hypothetical protein GEMRC1_000883 [Eukaryota sp. GEM-RC1]
MNHSFRWEERQNVSTLIRSLMKKRLFGRIGLEEYPAPWNATFSGIDLVTVPPSPNGHKRLFICVLPTAEISPDSSWTFTITAISAVPLRSGRPTTLTTSTAATSYYYIPVCSTDNDIISLQIYVNSGSVTKVHYSQDNGRPTPSDPIKVVSEKEFTTTIRISKQSPLFFAVHVSGSTNFSITASIPSKVVKELDLLTGELSRGCYAHFELQINSKLPLSAIYSKDSPVDSSFVYVSFNEENPQPDAIEFDDVSYLEKGGIISIPSFYSDVDKVFIGVAPTITMPNHLVRFALHLTQTHHVVLPGFITYLPVPESFDKPTYFVLSREIRIQAVAVGVQVLLPPSELSGLKMYGSRHEMLPSEESSHAQSGTGLLYDDLDSLMHLPGDFIHFYTAIASPPTDYAHSSLPIMINFVHRLSTLNNQFSSDYKSRTRRLITSSLPLLTVQ